MRTLRYGAGDKAASASDEGFDDFYLAERRRILLLCVAMTSDMAASRHAVRDTFVAANHHWRKVGQLEDRTAWIRPRAMANAHRRTAAKVRHRLPGATPAQATTLDALHKLSEIQRKALVLTHLGGVSLAGIGKELGLTQHSAEGHLRKATERFCSRLDCAPSEIQVKLQALAPLVTHPGLPRARTVRSHGTRRRRFATIGGSLAAIALMTSAGWAISGHETLDDLALVNQHKVDPTMLLKPAQLSPLAGAWNIGETDTNVTGTGLHNPCQQKRFADTSGVAAWVRTLDASAGSLQMVQTVEVSLTQKAAQKTFDTTLRWYADCTRSVTHLTSSSKVAGLGDEGWALTLDVISPSDGSPPATYQVVVVRSARITTTQVLRVPLGHPFAVQSLLVVAISGLGDLCSASAIGPCDGHQTAVSAGLPPNAETPGMLAVTDLPPLSGIPQPWVGTDPVVGGINVSATTCDNADFGAAGSEPTKTRTYLIPQANLPQQFGLTETYAPFPTDAKATAFVSTVRSALAACAQGHPGTTVDQHGDLDSQGINVSIWHIALKIDSKNTVVNYWMGVARRGRYVAQVNFAPSGSADIDMNAFWSLLLRTGDRLGTLDN